MATIHIIDWLGSAQERSIGISLMRLSHQGVDTQFGLGVSPSALAVGERAGYQLRGLVPVFNRILRAGYPLRQVGPGPLAKGLRLARELAGRLTRLPPRPKRTLVAERVAAFGSEIDEIVAKAENHAILTERSPSRLNAFLRFPRQDFTGWHIRDETLRLRGFALLNLVPHDEGETRTGKIVDCLLDEIEVPLWQAAILALTRELAHQRRRGPVLCIDSVAGSGTAGLRIRFQIRYQVPHPRSPGIDSPWRQISFDHARGRLRVHVIFRGIRHKREYLARALAQLGAAAARGARLEEACPRRADLSPDRRTKRQPLL